jgi:hypothetical protein
MLESYGAGASLSTASSSFCVAIFFAFVPWPCEVDVLDIT